MNVYRTVVAAGGNVCQTFDVLTIAHSTTQAEVLAVQHVQGVTRLSLRDILVVKGRTVPVALDTPRAIAMEEIDS